MVSRTYPKMVGVLRPHLRRALAMSVAVEVAAMASAGVLAQRIATISGMSSTRSTIRTGSGFAERRKRHSVRGAARVEKVWSDASSCVPRVDAGGPRYGARNRASMIEKSAR